MGRRVSLLVVLSICLAWFQAEAAEQRGIRRDISVRTEQGQGLALYKDYQALVVGVSDYDHWPRLPNAASDAREVTGALEALGFSVKLVTNPGSAQLREVLDDLAFRSGGELNRGLLFYFAGHGETLDLADGTKLGYIIPKDCPLKDRDRRGFDRAAVSMKDVEMVALKVRSKHVLMLFDSCFSGALFNLVRAAPTTITEKSAQPARQFITAGGAGETVPDRSVFKQVFLNGLEGDADLNHDGYVTASELGLHLQDKVVNYTRGGQHPQYGKINNPKLDRGDFIFALAAPGGGVVQPPNKPDDLAKEREKLEEERRLLAEQKKRLEEERRLAEEQKKLAEERARVEAERKRLEEEKRKAEKEKQEQARVATVSSPSASSSLAAGIIVKNNLEWYEGPDRDTTWDEARAWVAGLKVGGGGWRMPTRSELAGLYEKGRGSRNMDPAFQTTGWFVWSGELRDSSSAWLFFLNGFEGWGDRYYSSRDLRAFAVRSRR
ncbi:MAG: caspase family protein [Thermodesulfobacteriota bacterium]